MARIGLARTVRRGGTSHQSPGARLHRVLRCTSESSVRPGSAVRCTHIPYDASMAKRISAGILLYRRTSDAHAFEVLLAHPGGPLYVNKDAGHWSIPKGEVDGDEELLNVARREF